MATKGKPFKITRRKFLKAGCTLAAALPVWGMYKYFLKQEVPGTIVGAASSIGHKLKDFKFPAPSRTEKVSCVIIGGGIAGLSAAWRLQKRGFDKFILLELDHAVGGNSQSGENNISAYPWGAHYVPIPNKSSIWVRELFEELGVIEGYNSDGLPIYNEYYLCADPQERLYIHGHWQEGLVPQFGVSAIDREQYKAFFGKMEEFRKAVGNDGRPPFSIPVETSSHDPSFLALDQISMADYLKRNRWDSPYLNWYVNYCCRDDFGTTLDQVSAWAGIHYFAARSGYAANAAPQSVLTWPEGNGWLVKQLKTKVISKIRPRSLAFNISVNDHGQNIVDYFETDSNQVVRIISDTVIFAAPRFTTSHIIEKYKPEPPTYLNGFSYAPWMVANVTLNSLPSGPGAPLSWDNVSFHSNSLGYVLATHQRIERYQSKKTVVTYYLPLSGSDPVTERKAAYSKSPSAWKELVIQDLSKIHPGIEDQINNIDVWLWGHGMIRPTPGFIWGEDRRKSHTPHGNIFFANSDMSGISIFEEAQYWGVTAADQVLKASKVRKTGEA